MSVALSGVSFPKSLLPCTGPRTFERMHYHIKAIIQQQHLQLLGPQGLCTERVQRLHLIVVARGGHGDDLKAQLWMGGDESVADNVGLYESKLGGAGADVDRFLGGGGGGRPWGGERCGGHWRKMRGVRWGENTNNYELYERERKRSMRFKRFLQYQKCDSIDWWKRGDIFWIKISAPSLRRAARRK